MPRKKTSGQSHESDEEWANEHIGFDPFPTKAAAARFEDARRSSFNRHRMWVDDRILNRDELVTVEVNHGPWRY